LVEGRRQTLHLVRRAPARFGSTDPGGFPFWGKASITPRRSNEMRHSPTAIGSGVPRHELGERGKISFRLGDQLV
jgi:hypothetical protein